MAQRGLTMVIDRLSGLNKEEFEEVAKYVQILEIGWGLPLVWKEDSLRSRIAFYTKLGIKVSASGTLLERAMVDGSSDAMLGKLRKMGFDVVEVSDGIIDLTLNQKRNIAKKASAAGFELLYTVGKKDPVTQLSVPEALSQIEAGLELEPLKVVLEGRETGRGVGIYEPDGSIRWGTLRSITSRFDFNDLIFEAPLETQQAALILELGPEVNLGNVSLSSVPTLQSERAGLRFDTFGVDKPTASLKGGPATKFVLFAVRNYQPIDQKGLVSITQLPRRTVQKALESLLSQELVIAHPSFDDRRSKVYRTPSYSPMEKVRQP